MEQKNFTRFQLAAIKRTAQNVKPLLSRKERLEARIEEIQAEIAKIDEQINIWEEPITKMTKGFTSKEVLDGTYDRAQQYSTFNKPEDEPLTEPSGEVEEELQDSTFPSNYEPTTTSETLPF